MTFPSSKISALFVTIALSSCAALPSSGPSTGRVESDAAIKVLSSTSTRNYQAGADYALVDLSTAVLSQVGTAKAPDLLGSLGSARNGAPSVPLGVGDVVSVSIFESQQGGLFIPADAGSRPGNFVTLPSQTIERDGSITVPYAGQIRAVGRSVNAVERDIEQKLANRAIEPQVLINKITSRSAQVAVLGDVNGPAKIEVSEAGERVLDAISQAGGLSTPGQETYVTVQRGGKSATILYDFLTKTPSENIYVAPGDTVIVQRDRRSYVAFGASGLNGRFNFEDSDLTLGEALGQAGGLLDSRADPAQVLLYRVVDRAFLHSLGVDVSKYKSTQIPIIFRANLSDPSVFFLAQRFPMQDKDILYVSNSKSTELTKFLNIVNSVSATTANVPTDAVSVKDAVKRF